MTIVGIERTAVSYDLLIFDPMKTPNLSSAGSAIATTGSNAAAIPHVMRLEASKLFNKDCQMLICGKTDMTLWEREKRRGSSGVDRFALTAGVSV